MEEMHNKPAQEIRRLQRSISDLISVLGLSALWSSGDPPQVLTTFLEALLRLLSLEFIYARVEDPAREIPIETLRLASSSPYEDRTKQLCQALHQHFGDDPQEWPSHQPIRFEEEEIYTVPIQLGMRGEIGLLLAGARRPDFPLQTERLVLSVAANQAAIGLQHARLLSEQRRATLALDRHVAQRTTELAQANEELRREISERRLVEQKLREEERALRQSEARKTAILDSALDGIVTIDHEGCITEFNPAAEFTFGYRREEVIGKPLAAVIIPPSLREKHRQGFARHLATGESHVLGKRVEMTAMCADGSEIPVELAITRIPLEGPASFTGYLRNITDRKRSEDALRAAHAWAARNEERWRSVFENSAVGIALADLQGRFMAANPVYQKMLGYTEEELQELSTFDITLEEYREPNRALIGELLAEKRRDFQMEKQYRRKNGSPLWVRSNVSLVPGSAGTPRFLMAIVEDISDRKGAEDKLRRSEGFLAEGQRLSRTGSFSWCAETGEITWSEEVYRIFDFPQGAPLTLALITDRVHGDDLHILNKMVEQMRGAARDVECEYRLQMPDQSIKHLHMIAHGSRNPGDKLEYMGAVQDVTQRRLSEEALRKAQSEVENVARISSLGMLTASIAHEVNQPLSGIVTNASTCLRMLAADPPNVDGARETARRTIRDGNRASEVITRLRALFGKKSTLSELLDLNDAAREVIALLLAELQQRRVILRQELADRLPLVRGDRVQLQQVILNLVRNATDSLSAVEDRPRQVVIRTGPDGEERVFLAVRDSGVGFDPGAAEKLFEAFHTTKTEGMGIGLSVSRSIIESHHGRLWASLNDGPGATFSFSIPRGASGLMHAG